MSLNKKTVIIDLWVLLALVLLLSMSGLIDHELSETELQSIEENKGDISEYAIIASYIMTHIALIMIVCGILTAYIYMQRCGRIKRYRYLVLYAECKRLTPHLEKIIDIVATVIVYVVFLLVAICVYLSWQSHFYSFILEPFKSTGLVLVILWISVHKMDEDIF